MIKKFTKDFIPMFRDADAQGLLGIRAYLYYFQDAASEHLYHMGKGNDILPEKYGAAWMYTKYRLKVFRQEDFSRPLHVETWIEKMDKIRILQNVKITAGNEVCAIGRVGNCILLLENQTIGKLSDIGMTDEVVLGDSVEVERFSRIRYDIADMSRSHFHIVQYSDLDKSHHMTNLRYVNLMEDVFSPEFCREHIFQEIELHYKAQSFYGEEIEIYKKHMDSECLIAGKKKDGTVVFGGRISF